MVGLLPDFLLPRRCEEDERRLADAQSDQYSLATAGTRIGRSEGRHA